MSDKLTEALDTLSEKFDTSINVFDVLITIYQNQDKESLALITDSSLEDFTYTIEEFSSYLCYLVNGYGDISNANRSTHMSADGNDRHEAETERHDRANFQNSIEEAKRLIDNFHSLDLAKEMNKKENAKASSLFKPHLTALSEMINLSEEKILLALPKAHLIEKQLIEFSGLRGYIR